MCLIEHFLVHSCIFGLSDSNPLVCDSNPFFRRFQNWKIALAILIVPEGKMSLSDSNHSFENSNPLCREPEMLRFNLSDSNHSFEDSNPLTISGLKPLIFFKWIVLFNKHIFAPFSNPSQTQSNSAFKLFFSKPTHIHISYHNFSSFHYPSTQNPSWNLHTQKNPKWNRQLYSIEEKENGIVQRSSIVETSTVCFSKRAHLYSSFSQCSSEVKVWVSSRI